MKHLKLSVELKMEKRSWLGEIPTAVLSTVIEQTHKCSEFGNSSINDSWFTYLNKPNNSFLHGRVRLVSNESPFFWGEHEHRHSKEVWIFFGGRQENLDSEAIEIPFEYWPEVLAAINAYNETFKD